MEKVYVLKVAFKARKGLWREIEIMGNQTLGDFDQIIRSAFGHDTFDHLSEFFLGRAGRSEGLGEINPFGEGSGSRVRVEQLGLFEGDIIEYVYDFGDDIQHVITLEKIVKPAEGVQYPRISSRNKPRHRYCETCKNDGRKTVATWICIKCSEKMGKAVFFCEECMENEHPDHYAEELVY